MWFLRAELVAGTMMLLLLCNSECKPQNTVPDISCLSNDDFLSGLTGGGTAASGEPCPTKKQANTCTDGKCVPFDQCTCRSKPSPATGTNGAPIIEGIVDDRNFDLGCGGSILRLCCDTECTTTSQNPTPPSTTGTTKPPPTGCGIRNPEGVGVTINGFEQKQAQLGEFPWMVAILDHATTYVGGGSLVHPRVILTAGHKVHKREANTLVARIGDWDLSGTDEPIANQNINVERILFHPGFDRETMVNNVALLILEREATLGETVMPICLPEPGVTYGTDCVVTGWGKNVFGEKGIYQMIMKEVHVPSVSHSECQRLLRNTRLGSDFNLHNTFNCAGANGEDACEGDGGSPLVCPKPNKPNEYVQTGVVAWGIGCGEVGKPGVYGSIPQTVDWITRTIAEQAQPELGFDIRGKPDQ